MFKKKTIRTKASYDPTESERELKHREIAYRAAIEGIVLLENDGVLPLKPGKIALYGAGAGKTIKGGTGSGEVNERHSISILEGLEETGYTVTTKKWINDYARLFQEEERKYAQKAKKRMLKLDIINLMADPFQYPFGRMITDDDIKESETDTCIYVVARQSGEGADRRLDSTGFYLSEIEKKNLKKCAENYAHTIVVINIGSVFDLSFLEQIPGINALIYFCQQGTAGGKAFADIISGEISPSGKLVDTWPEKYEDIPFAHEFSYLNGDLENEYYKEGIYVGYRYFDTFKIKPRFEFGYGLSYTSFDIDFLDAKAEKNLVRITAEVKNSGGEFSGKEVIQLYASCPEKNMPKEYQRLAAFAKTKTLDPGEKQEITLDLDISSLASYDEKRASFILEPGEYILRLGNSSRNTIPCAFLFLDREIIISRHQNICKPETDFEEIKPREVDFQKDLSRIPKIEINAAEIETQSTSYQKPPIYSNQKVDKLIQKLSIKEMVELVVGAGMSSTIGDNNYFTCPGAVGNTTSKLVNKGIINIPLADGPAGLRLSKISAVNKKGQIKMVEPMIEFLKYLPGIIKKLIFASPRKNTLIYQFTTAFPVEGALAQTWNIELLEEIGEAISTEMLEYGVSFWLAPGLNIHRNPLCGRNFEYYSEDPYLTGEMAAAVTRGVQSIEGNYVTLKHFVANNQEDNRNKVSSNVKERALREIYLRGFEIAVKKGKARGVMTSYNRVNGTYTTNSYDLCTKVLRNEWGFNGVVMTDWYATGKGLASNGLCMKAGNDLIMPGGRYYKKEILSEMKKGTIEEQDIRRCATNVLCSIVHSRLAREYKLDF